uniref:Uncharacterized protein n=1 Tax=Noctiluca scintillans TaxID=2966 RepID=A0A7S0ZP47_NOCSC
MSDAGGRTPFGNWPIPATSSVTSLESLTSCGQIWDGLCERASKHARASSWRETEKGKILQWITSESLQRAIQARLPPWQAGGIQSSVSGSHRGQGIIQSPANTSERDKGELLPAY